MGLKSALPFSKVKEKSSFFQHTCTCICTVIRKYSAGGHNVPRPPGPNRVNDSGDRGDSDSLVIAKVGNV